MAKILIIEDDDIMRDFLSDLLKREGYLTEAVSDGAKGLSSFKKEYFDLIITDIIMPEKEGIETIVDIRKLDQKIPIIAISGGGRLSPKRYLPLAAKLGADYTFMKPFDNHAFLAAVRDCLD